MSDPRSNSKIMEALVTSLCNIHRAEERGDRECPKERATFGRLYSEALSRLDNTKAPFESGDKVRLKPSEAKELKRYWVKGPAEFDLAEDTIYIVDHCWYEGEENDDDGWTSTTPAHWMVALTVMPSTPGCKTIGYGAELFEKVKIVKAA